ncbi:MAG: HAD-IIIA family hydrolase [Clostridia bacterium]
MKRYDAVIFDLDGTLLDTLEDLTAATNHAMRENGYPEHTPEEVRYFVGNGIGRLLRRALPPEADGDEAVYEEALQAFTAYYAQHHNDTTAPYPGVVALLRTLKASGVRLAIVSNKNAPNVRALAEEYFDGLVSFAVGEQAGVRRKPHPDMVLRVMEAWGCDPKRTLYVGDSDVDVQTAQNAGIDCAAVLWGFRAEHELRRAGATVLIRMPEELSALVLGSTNAPCPCGH